MELGAIALVRWALYSDLGLLFGIPLFGFYSPGAARFGRNLLLLLVLLGVALTLASLQLTAAEMADAPATQFDPQLLEVVIGQTGFGQAALLRLGLLACLVAPLILAASADGLCSLLGGGALLTLAWGGHGVSTSGAGGMIHLAADLVHLLAAGAWLGALAMLLRTLSATPDASHSAFKRFARVGTLTVIALAVSGAVNAAYLIDFTKIRLGRVNSYDRLLLVKLALFGGMLMLATINRFVLTPRLAPRSAAMVHAGARRALHRSIAIECGLALAILALVGWLGMLDPAA
jgi:putative copper resistance protein D